MHTCTLTRAAKRTATFAAAFAAALLLFCASGDVGSARRSRRTTTASTPAPYDSARGVNVAVSDYTVTTTGGAIVVTDVSGNGDTLIVAEPAGGLGRAWTCRTTPASRSSARTRPRATT